MGTALRIWAWTLGEEALVGGVTDSDHVLRNTCFKAEGEEGGEDLEGRRLILWGVEVGWAGVEVGFLTYLMTTILSLWESHIWYLYRKHCL